jgi:hypothetical protein
MPKFKAPIYSKTKNEKTGAVEASYIFLVDFDKAETGVSFVASEANDLVSVELLQQCLQETPEWWTEFISLFLKTNSKLFSKQYTAENINKIVRHTLVESPLNNKNNTFPLNVILFPKTVQIVGGVFVVKWEYVTERFIIDIPTMGDSEHGLNEVVDGIQEFNVDDLNENTTDEKLDMEDPNKIFEKQKVKEARLKAKVALYKAQQKMTAYYEKYGNDVSDSDSESDSEEEDEEEDDA